MSLIERVDDFTSFHSSLQRTLLSLDNYQSETENIIHTIREFSKESSSLSLSSSSDFFYGESDQLITELAQIIESISEYRGKVLAMCDIEGLLMKCVYASPEFFTDKIGDLPSYDVIV